MPSWPAVIVGAVVVGALLGTAQKGEVDVAVDTGQNEPEQAPQRGSQASSGERSSAGSAQGWPDEVWTTLPSRRAPRVALTFDDGPHARWTPQVLDVLARHDATATFCVVGDAIEGNERVLRRIHAEGHVLCNHTATHDYGLPARGPARITEEIRRLDEAVARVIPDAEIGVFRAPGGRFAPEVVAGADAEGLTSWAWSLDPQDWRTEDADAIVTSVLDGITPDAVVLLHDGGGDRSATVAAVSEIVPVLASVGYDFVGLPSRP